jgi:hypothetical protein
MRYQWESEVTAPKTTTNKDKKTKKQTKKDGDE